MADRKTWLEDGKTLESRAISPGYQAVIRQETMHLAVYAVSSKQARHIASVDTLQEARAATTEYIDSYLAWLEKRRLQAPTNAQLGMLFFWRIPIPLDLTFGQAWDIIDARMQKERTEKAARAERRRASPEQVKR